MRQRVGARLWGSASEPSNNPGWSLRVELTGTAVAQKGFAAEQVHRSEHDWYDTKVERGAFLAACGPLNLGEVIHIFRVWADGPPALPT